jgi:predicted Zn-dependent protease with MMP-like domain
MTLQMSAAEFERIVGEELDALPDEMVDGLENVAFVVEDADEHGEDLFGRYEGVDLTQRGQYGFGELPDRIVVFRLPHLESAETVEDLRHELHTTLVHEIGHFYGIDDDRLHELGWA